MYEVGSNEWRLSMEIADIMLGIVDESQCLSTSDLQGRTEIKAFNIMEDVKKLYNIK